MLRGHAARRHLLDFLFRHIGHCPASPSEHLEALQFLILNGGHEIPRRPPMTGHGDRLSLSDFPVLAEIASEFCRRNLTHSIPLLSTFYVFYAILSRN